jgi:drug/metabolite transporter (DMT)-like permease
MHGAPPPASTALGRPFPHPLIHRLRSKLSGNARGIFAMLAGMTFFIVGDTFMKLATATLPTSQAVGLRGIVAIPLSIAVALALGGRNGLAGALSWRVLLRGLIEIGIVFAFLTALSRLPIATITAITQIVPFVVTAAVVVLGLEVVGIRRWSAVVVGFLGVMLITRPDVRGFDPAVGYALLCAVLVAVRDLFTRTIGAGVSSSAITVTSACMVAASGVAVSAFGAWRPPGLFELACVFAAGFVVIGGNLMMVVASRDAEVSVVQPYRYAIIPLGILAGFFVWGETPDLLSALGMAIIVGAGLYTFHREVVRGQIPHPPPAKP